MNENSIKELKKLIIEGYRKYGDDKALVTKGKKSYTGFEMAKEIEDETEFGIEMLNNLIQLTIDLLKRNKMEITEDIKWDIDHDCSYGYYILSGDYKGHRFTRIVNKGFWGFPLMYAKWCITRSYKMLYPKYFK